MRKKGVFKVPIRIASIVISQYLGLHESSSDLNNGISFSVGNTNMTKIPSNVSVTWSDMHMDESEHQGEDVGDASNPEEMVITTIPSGTGMAKSV